MTGTACRSVVAEVQVLEAHPADSEQRPHARTTLFIAADEPVFDGHYPGFPILPGVALIECAHRSVLATLPAQALSGPARLAAVESARFLDPVYPGDTVTVELTWKPAEGSLSCRAVLRTERGESARVRLRYTNETAADVTAADVTDAGGTEAGGTEAGGTDAGGTGE